MRTSQTDSRIDTGPRTGGVAAAATPRRIILDLFGDYLRYNDSEVRLGQLTTLLGEFGVAPATVRVTMSRLRKQGWFTSYRQGRETVYRLTDSLQQILDDGRDRIFARPATGPLREWTMVIYSMTEDDRAERQRLRRQLTWHGFGALSTSTWLAPGDCRDVARRLARSLPPHQIDVLRCRSDGVGQDRELAGRCWDLPALAADYEDFIAVWRTRGSHAPAGGGALVDRTELIAQWRQFPFRDPGLPADLLPADWPGDAARALFRRLHADLGPAARDYVGEVIGHVIDDR